ncbi:hypothetical protein [Streptomyces sp. V4I23]|uniref:competence protein CoiA family protein n=1 Tax=Streptomyces sp. V4I23 TaxID=3042282 RepID=UPI0027D8DC56|nr:hypothetical protein [Streptomyces sp. V4I23]
MNSGPQRPRAFAQETAQVLAVDGKSGQLRYLPDKRGNDEMEPGVTWRAYLAEGMLLCPMPGCGPFGRVVAGGARRHHFAHPAGAGEHDRGTGPETLWHLSAKDVLRRWMHTHPGFADWTLHIDDTPIIMPDGQRRPDLLAIAPDGSAKVAFEVQYSPLTGTNWKARHDFYAAAGVVDIWLFAHHGPQWRTATARQRRRKELAWSDPGWVATIQLSGLHQKMLQDGVIPLWLDPTAQMVGTATARFHPAPALPGERLGEDTAYNLPPHKTFPACHVAADALEHCQVDLAAGELLTPARHAHRKEHSRFLADEQVAQERAARIRARLHAEQQERTRRRRAAEQEKRRAIAAQVAADQAERDKHEQEELRRKEEERAAAEALQKMPLREQFPPLFQQDPPPPAKPPWWQSWRRRA